VTGPGPPSSVGINYSVNLPGDRLKLKLHSAGFEEKDGRIKDNKMSYGLAMHEVLSSVITRGQIDIEIDRASLAGMISSAEGRKLKENLDHILDDNLVSGWFSENATVLNEREVLLPGSGSKRPDRVVISNGKVQIIDFKFGEERNDHHKQVREYMHLYRKIGYKEVLGFLWYVEKNLVFEVKPE
jgi:hypothetical protein